MKTILRSLAILLLFAFAMVACSKPSSGGGGGGETPTPEENVSITIDPNPGSSTTPIRATGASYAFNVVLQSRMPSLGIEVKVKYTRDSDGTVISGNDITTTTNLARVPITISNITMYEMGTVTVTVTSKSNASNKATTSFKLVRK